MPEHRAFAAPLGLDVRVVVERDAIVAVSLAQPGPRVGAHPFLDRILAHLATGKDDLRDLPVRADVTEFHARVHERLRAIPPGEATTYGALAKELGSVARAVGGACARNPVPLVVPCHRVVGGTGDLVHFGCEGGVATKRRLLEIEGAWPLRARGQLRLV